MSFQAIDWVFFVGLLVALVFVSFFFRRFAKSVAGFLVAGRNVGRYLGLESDSMAGLGAITILATWQMTYESGFVGNFWFLLKPLAATLVALTGFGIYRFRQTRAMTLGQFVEMRYSKKTRILFGLIAYAAGVLNMGIFPGIGARFFVFYCGFPAVISLWGLEIPMYVILMVIMVGAAIIICFNGGQITLVVTNFVQALFVNVMLILIMFALYKAFTWQQVTEAFISVENANDLLQPFTAQQATEFNKFFFLITVFWMIYWVISWQPNSLVTSSAKDAHEAKMMRTMVEIKKIVYLGLGIGVLPLAVIVLMNHPDFTDKAAMVRQSISHIDNRFLRTLLTTPAALKYILPTGLLGGFAGFVLFAFMSTHTSYLLAWGGTLVQDVIIPVRNKRFEPRQHMMWIRISIIFVALFIVLFSTFYPLNDRIFMFLDLTGGLFLSGCSVVLLGGLYFKRGTITAAFTSMITGIALTISGFIYRIYDPEFLNGTVMSFYIALICIAEFVSVSFLTKDVNIDLNKLLNRRKEDIEARKNLKWYQFSLEVPRGDRILIPCMYVAIALFIVGFIGTWIYNSFVDISTEKWMSFWHGYICAMFGLGGVFLLWVIAGGFRDLFRLFRNLRIQKVDVTDDGRVTAHHTDIGNC